MQKQEYHVTERVFEVKERTLYSKSHIPSIEPAEKPRESKNIIGWLSLFIGIMGILVNFFLEDLKNLFFL